MESTGNPEVGSSSNLGSPVQLPPLQNSESHHTSMDHEQLHEIGQLRWHLGLERENGKRIQIERQQLRDIVNTQASSIRQLQGEKQQLRERLFAIEQAFTALQNNDIANKRCQCLISVDPSIILEENVKFRTIISNIGALLPEIDGRE